MNFSILLFLNSPKKEEDINVLATKNINKNLGFIYGWSFNKITNLIPSLHDKVPFDPSNINHIDLVPQRLILELIYSKF